MNAGFGDTLVNLTELDLDTPVYRIYAIDRFEALRSRTVKPVASRCAGDCSQDGQEGWPRYSNSDGGGRQFVGRLRDWRSAPRCPCPGASRFGGTETANLGAVTAR